MLKGLTGVALRAASLSPYFFVSLSRPPPSCNVAQRSGWCWRWVILKADATHLFSCSFHVSGVAMLLAVWPQKHLLQGKIRPIHSPDVRSFDVVTAPPSVTAVPWARMLMATTSSLLPANSILMGATSSSETAQNGKVGKKSKSKTESGETEQWVSISVPQYRFL